jgi:hypothetical protein
MLQLPIHVQENVLRGLDVQSIGCWAQSCKSAAKHVRESRAKSCEHLCNKVHVAGQGNWMIDCILEHRRQRCLLIQKVDTCWMSAQPMIRVSNVICNGVSAALAYVLIVDTTNADDLYACLELIVEHSPECIFIMSDGELTKGVLSDHHLKLLHGITYVAIPGNKSVTDLGVAHLEHAKCIWIQGCTSIKGHNIRQVVYQRNKLLSIKWIGGWGASAPFSPQVWRWLKDQESRGLIVNQW